MKRVLHQKLCDCFAHKQVATVACLFRRRQRTCEHLLSNQWEVVKKVQHKSEMETVGLKVKRVSHQHVSKRRDLS